MSSRRLLILSAASALLPVHALASGGTAPGARGGQPPVHPHAAGLPNNLRSNAPTFRLEWHLARVRDGVEAGTADLSDFLPGPLLAGQAPFPIAGEVEAVAWTAVPVTARTTRGYIARSTQASGSPGVVLEPGTVTAGFDMVMTLAPTDDGSVRLDYTGAITWLDEMGEFRPAGSDLVVQLPQTTGQAVAGQRVILPGRREMIGFGVAGRRLPEGHSGYALSLVATPLKG